MSSEKSRLNIKTTRSDREKVWDFGKPRTSGGGGNDGGGHWVRAKKVMSPEALEKYKSLSRIAKEKLEQEGQASSPAQASGALSSSLL